jgi:enterochelin esterase family protein
VSAEGRVTIRYYHPTARAVWCKADWNDWEPVAMRGGPEGIWSFTSEPLPPDLYEYSIIADGALVVDYKNSAAKNRFSSFVHVPGPRLLEPRDAAHGAVHVHWYPSAVTGTLRRMHVYTPPGYHADAAQYPVLYLLHGAGDDDESWVRTGRVNFIMDNLLAGGRARPMVIVMPDGHVLGANWKEHRGTKLRAFAADFYAHVIPEAERLYRVRSDAGHRAMAGLSMGGGQTISTGMTHPGMFSAFGLFSSGLWPEITPLLEEALPGLRQNPPGPLWVGIGRRDFLFEHCALLRRTLDAGGIACTYHEDDTTHSWRTWRDYFERFAPLLFPGP